MFQIKAITVIATAAVLLSNLGLPQQASAGELGNFLRSLKDQGKQTLRTQLNSLINGALPSSGYASPSYGTASSYGSQQNYNTQAAGQPEYQSAQEQAPYPAPSSNPYPSSVQSSGLDPSIYDAPGTPAPTQAQAAPSTYSNTHPHLTPGPVINGFGSRRASIN